MARHSVHWHFFPLWRRRMRIPDGILWYIMLHLTSPLVNTNTATAFFQTEQIHSQKFVSKVGKIFFAQNKIDNSMYAAEPKH